MSRARMSGKSTTKTRKAMRAMRNVEMKLWKKKREDPYKNRNIGRWERSSKPPYQPNVEYHNGLVFLYIIKNKRHKLKHML